MPDRPERSSADLSQKLATLREACASLAIPWSRGHVDVKCRRSAVAETALAIASSRPARDFRKTWRFELTGERGMDAGGVARECWAHVAEGGVEIKILRRVIIMMLASTRHRRGGVLDGVAVSTPSTLDDASTAAARWRGEVDASPNFDFDTGRRGSVLR